MKGAAGRFQSPKQELKSSYAQAQASPIRLAHQQLSRIATYSFISTPEPREETISHAKRLICWITCVGAQDFGRFKACSRRLPCFSRAVLRCSKLDKFRLNRGADSNSRANEVLLDSLIS